MLYERAMGTDFKGFPLLSRPHNESFFGEDLVFALTLYRTCRRQSLWLVGLFICNSLANFRNRPHTHKVADECAKHETASPTQ